MKILISTLILLGFCNSKNNIKIINYYLNEIKQLSSLKVYARSYNMIRIYSGMPGLKYSN